MGRVKDAKDWLLTWSPEEGVHGVPRKIQEFMDGSDITRYHAVIEESGKKHLHIAFTTRCTYNSDYKWWKKIFEQHGFKEPALDIKYHNNIVMCAGGYLQGEVVGNKGFSEEQLEYGATQYDLRNVRQRVRHIVDDHIVLSRDKYEVAIGAIMADQEVTREEAEQLAIEMGFAFGTSRRGLTEDYAEIFREKKRMS